jgi:hypothetical protein
MLVLQEMMSTDIGVAPQHMGSGMATMKSSAAFEDLF